MELKMFDHTPGSEYPIEVRNEVSQITALRDVLQKYGLVHLLSDIVYFPKGRPRVFDNKLMLDDGEALESITVGQIVNVMVGFSNIS